jgi:hypothetical protein
MEVPNCNQQGDENADPSTSLPTCAQKHNVFQQTPHGSRNIPIGKLASQYKRRKKVIENGN